MGRKPTRYLDVMKWVTSNSLQKRKSPTIGKIIISSNNNSFFRDFDKAREKMVRITATIISGEWGSQSLKTFKRILQKEPMLSIWNGSIKGWPL